MSNFLSVVLEKFAVRKEKNRKLRIRVGKTLFSRSRRSLMFFKVGALKNFAIFIGLSLKRDFNTGVFL